MKKTFLIILLLGAHAYAQDQKIVEQKGVCKDQTNYPFAKYRCWFGTDGNDLIQVFGQTVKIGPYPDSIVATDCSGVKEDMNHVEYGAYDKTLTNIFFGLNGADRIETGAGRDIVYGGSCNDYIEGGAGDDDLYGGANTDVLYGMKGKDKLYGGSSKDFMTGGPDEDTFYIDQPGEDPERNPNEKEYKDTTTN